MPIRWDEKNKLTLLLRIVERCPPSQDDLKWVLGNWPDPEKPTLRAIQEQIKSLRKQMTNGSSPKTPKKNISSSKATSTSTPTRPATVHTRRNKKRKLKDSDLEEESPVLTDSEEEENEEAIGTSSDEGNSPLLTPSKRVLPARGKSRGLKLVHNNENGSERNTDDTEEDSEEESEFDDQKSGGGEKDIDDKRSIASKRSWRTAPEYEAWSNDEI